MKNILLGDCSVCGASPLNEPIFRAIRKGTVLYLCKKHLKKGDLLSAKLDMVKKPRPIPEGPVTIIESDLPASPGFDVMECPASMCPLVAHDGSPWTKIKSHPCPGHDDIEAEAPHTGCPWWSRGCSKDSKVGGIQKLVEQADRDGGKAYVTGPNQPRRLKGEPRTYDCPKASVCRWQQQATAESGLCPPRDALARGLDPRVTLF